MHARACVRAFVRASIDMHLRCCLRTGGTNRLLFACVFLLFFPPATPPPLAHSRSRNDRRLSSGFSANAIRRASSKASQIPQKASVADSSRWPRAYVCKCLSSRCEGGREGGSERLATEAGWVGRVGRAGGRAGRSQMREEKEELHADGACTAASISNVS